ncbi:MAG: hypothetical protein K8I60_06350 [Anaerolineae bacterium]|nr:hypothetical protein [Anaerolineae bacterium]
MDMKSRIALLVVMLLLNACSGQSSAEQTLVVQRDTLATQMDFVYQTATFGSDRLMQTVEYIETLTTRVAIQGTRLAQTLEARGTDVSFIQGITPQPGSLATGIPQPGAVETAPAQSQPAATVPTPTEAPPSLYNVVTAPRIGENDCAVGQVSTFSTTDTAIYVVATAANIVPGTELAARWSMEGQEITRQTFIPDFPINQACIWFYIDQTDAIFTPSNWSVQLEINGAPAGSPLNFTIAGS